MSNSYDASLQHKTQQHQSRIYESGSEPSRKRKRTEAETSISTPEQIRIEGSQTGRSRLLESVCIVRRSQIPLSFLDTSEYEDRLFRSKIKSLEQHALEDVSGTTSQANILIAKDQDLEALFAIERVSRNVYALCRIGSWVGEEVFDALAGQKSDVRPALKKQATEHLEKGAWWQSAKVDINVDDGTKAQKSQNGPRLCMLHGDVKIETEVHGSCLTRKSSPQPRDRVGPSMKPGEPASVQDIPEGKIEDMTTHSSEDPHELVSLLVGQYLDALYKTRTSLAYFAKGPISRVRAAFNHAHPLGTTDLADHLEQLILSSVVADKKYRDVLPEALKDIPLQLDTEDADHVDKAKSKRKRKSKKLRIDKKGLLPDELDCFAFWWRNDDQIPPSGEDMQQQFRRRAVELRTREAFLQVIIILEMLALRSSPTAAKDSQATISDDQIKNVPDQTKRRKGVDTSVALEILLDKLCIWHSLEQTVADDAKKTDQAKKVAPDHLRNFCTEVIIPFYSSRITDRAAAVIKKLGGLSARSPQKQSSKDKNDGMKDRTDSGMKKPRDALHRVSSEKLASASKRVPSLSRSATDSFARPTVKKQPSDVSLQRDSQSPVTGQSSTKSISALDRMRGRHREVDFEAVSEAQEAKKRKKAEIDQKVREAINEIKKPDRKRAGQATMDAVEQRQIMAQARARSQAQNQRQRASSNVQIDATPKHSRTKIFTVAETPQDRASKRQSDHAPSSSSMVQASTAKHPTFASSGTGIPQSDHRERRKDVQATPIQSSRTFAMPAMPVVRPFPLASLSANKGVQETPRHQRTVDMCTETPVKDRDVVDATPVKKLDLNDGLQDTREWGGASNIYDALGWDD